MGYNDYGEIDSGESHGLTFDFKGFLYKILHLWKFVLLCIATGLLVAYLINVRKQNIYRLESLVSVENDQNPFFTANTSISFNWGGVSGKMGKTITTLKTRTHNEKVVDSLQHYLIYLKEGKYDKIDIYNEAPFVVNIDLSKPQLLNKWIGIRFINQNQFEVFTEFKAEKAQAQRYDTKEKETVAIPVAPFQKSYDLKEEIALPFLNASITKRAGKNILPNSEYFIQFKNFDAVVNAYKKGITVRPFDKNSSSVLTLSLAGTNKAKIVDYLNATAAILSSTELERKNLYATNTIKFIDSSLAAVNTNLKDVTDEMNQFRQKNKVFNVDAEMQDISSRLKDFETQKEEERTKINYLNRLENYLLTKTDYTNIAAPTSVGISEANILNSVSKITSLAIERQSLEYTTREESAIFKNIDRKIDAEKNVLLETIKSTLSTINLQINSINRNIANFEAKLSGLPQDQQEYLKIQRKLDISQEAYNVYMKKRSEAAIVKAANISDISIIDEAKDIGGGLIGPNKSLNYVMGLLLGISIPIIIIFIVYLLDNTIQGSDEVERLSKIPIIGLIGKYKHKNNLLVFEKPKSPVAESFRAIRSSLQFFYKKDANNSQHLGKGKTLMVTSSISGEGKTFCSINLATAYALSGKKTILVGLDLRKPKIFDDFNFSNETGIVNYLIEDNTLAEVTQTTYIENLDVITSGPIPPNPSELLMSDSMNPLIETLREKYDIIVLDTPPLGLVTDALELVQYADASIYMLRLNYTKKGMLQLVNAKYKAGELKNISFVLNFYKHKTNQNYGYGYGYGYGVYGNAYHEDHRRKSIFKRIKDKFK